MGNMMGSNSMMGGGTSPANFIGGFIELLFWVLIIIGVVLLIKWLVDQSNQALPRERSNAVDILKLRYAKGEIDQKEFQSKLADLGS